MRKLLALVLVLGLTTVASAALKLSVNGVVDPPDSSINIGVSDWVTIDIWSSGGDVINAGHILVSGPGSYNTDNAINYINEGMIFEQGPGDIFVDLFIFGGPPPPPLPSGTVADMILVHADAVGDIILSLQDGEVVMDTQVIHVPEPMTLALLGLGGLFIRRK